MNRKEIDEIASAIVERFHPKRVVLFGSHARGAAVEDSDLDLFVEMESDRTPPERVVEVGAIFGLRPWSLDLVVYTPDEVAKLKGVPGTLVSRIEAEGEALYQRA